MKLDGYCPECGGGEGNQSCKIAKCSLSHDGVEYCSRCVDFPCEQYWKEDEFDSFITHRNRMKDFEKVGQIGMEAYQAEQRAKMEILDCEKGKARTQACCRVAEQSHG